MVKKWPIFYPLILVLLSLIPTYGGLFTLGILIYGMVNCGSLCDAPSDMFR